MVRGPFGPLASIVVWSQLPFCQVFAALPLPLCPPAFLTWKHLHSSMTRPLNSQDLKCIAPTQASSLYLYLYPGTRTKVATDLFNLEHSQNSGPYGGGDFLP